MAESKTEERSSKSRDLTRIVPAVALVVLLVIFAVDNRQRVTVGFVVTERKVPLIVVLIATAIIGALVSQLMGWRRRH